MLMRPPSWSHSYRGGAEASGSPGGRRQMGTAEGHRGTLPLA